MYRDALMTSGMGREAGEGVFHKQMYVVCIICD